MIIEGAHSQSIPVAMCGEMAGDPYAAVILLGLGLDVFSMSSFSIPEIKNIIRSVSMVEAEELVGTIFEMKSYQEIRITSYNVCYTKLLRIFEIVYFLLYN